MRVSETLMHSPPSSTRRDFTLFVDDEELWVILNALEFFVRAATVGEDATSDTITLAKHMSDWFEAIL